MQWVPVAFPRRGRHPLPCAVSSASWRGRQVPGLLQHRGHRVFSARVHGDVVGPADLGDPRHRFPGPRVIPGGLLDRHPVAVEDLGGLIMSGQVAARCPVLPDVEVVVLFFAYLTAAG